MNTHTELTAEEEQQLLELSNDLASAQTSPWEPACIARVFSSIAPSICLTMQRWIDLDALRSPLLQGQLPETLEELSAAAEVFDLAVDELGTEDCVLIAQAMQRACNEAFAMALKMKQPNAGPADEDDGFGTWLPLYACLVTECGISPDDALALRVDRAFALLAAMRRNQGWQVAGTPYALREIQEPRAESQVGRDAYPQASEPLNTQPSTLN